MSKDEEMNLGTASAGSGNITVEDSGQLGIIVLCLVLILILDLLNFGEFWFGRVVRADHWLNFSSYIRSATWPDFLREAKMYIENFNLFLTNIILDEYIKINRAALGDGAPLMDYLFQKIIRFTGFISIFIGGVFFVLLAFFEGNKRRNEKRIYFEKLSSTIYHFSLRGGKTLAICIMIVYMFLPGRIYIPGFLKIEVPLFFINPIPWVIAFILVNCVTVYTITSNASYRT